MGGTTNRAEIVSDLMLMMNSGGKGKGRRLQGGTKLVSRIITIMEEIGREKCQNGGGNIMTEAWEMVVD